jgi:hypothetical protein
MLNTRLPGSGIRRRLAGGLAGGLAEIAKSPKCYLGTGTVFQPIMLVNKLRFPFTVFSSSRHTIDLRPVLRIRTDLDRIRPLRTDRIRIHLSKMYLVVPKV